MNDAAVGRPLETEYYAAYYNTYLRLVPEDDILEPMATQVDELRTQLRSVGEKSGFRYAAGKWSVRELVGHLVDSERLFGYRALCISRGEQAPLPGYDENAYIETSTYDETPLDELLNELDLLRRANLVLFRRMTQQQWHRRGIANGKEVTVRALAWIIVGHFRHHRAILEERYLAAI